jgi:hypothetical protein
MKKLWFTTLAALSFACCSILTLTTFAGAQNRYRYVAPQPMFVRPMIVTSSSKPSPDKGSCDFIKCNFW